MTNAERKRILPLGKKNEEEEKRTNKGCEGERERERESKLVGLVRHRRVVWANATGCDTFKKSQHVNQK